MVSYPNPSNHNRQFKEEQMLIPAALHKDEHSVYGITIPDLPGCFSCGNTVEEAVKNAQEAAYMHITGMIEDGEFENLTAGSIDKPNQAPEYRDAVWIMLEIDPSRIIRQTNSLTD